MQTRGGGNSVPDTGDSAASCKRFRTLPGKKNVDSLIKDLEKELTGMQTDVLDGFNKLERKIQCYRKPKS